MSYPAYPEYKDSGVEWLGEVPGHWEIIKVAHGFSNIGSGTTPPSNEQKWYEGGSIPWITTSELRENLIFETKKTLTDEALSVFTSLQVHPPGSLAIAMYGATIERLGIFGVSATTNQACCVLSGSKSISPRFAFYWLLAFKDTIISLYATGGGQPNVNQETIANLRLPVPSLADQAVITTCLDHETARIDALVEEQQRLIALLKEKRQAVISHAVTKGLDPDVPMKDSGVEWLGEVPEHWDVVPTGYRYEVQLGRMLNETRASGENLKPYLRVFDVQWEGINTQDLPLMDFPPNVQKTYRLEAGDLMVNEGGSYVGRSAIWRGELGECYYQKALHRLRPRLQTADTGDYFLYVMEMATQKGVFVANANQTTIDHLTAEQLRSHRFAFPPLDEQIDIARYLENATNRLERLTEEAQGLIRLMQERRSALISAAVTGKIDVRGWQPPEKLQAANDAQKGHEVAAV